MTEEKDKGITQYGEWFCSKDCLKKFEKGKKYEYERISVKDTSQ